MNHFTFSGLVVSMTTLVLGSFVLSKKKSRVGVIFFFYSFSIAFWSFFVFLHGPNMNKNYAFTLGRLLHVGAIFIPIFFLHFTLILTNFIDRWELRLRVIYIVGVVFLFTNLVSKKFISGTTFTTNYAFPTPGPVYPIFFIFFISLIIISLLLLRKKMKAAKSSHEKTRMALLYYSSIIGYTGGMDNFAITKNVHIPLLYPYGTYAIALYAGVMAYAIIKHSFLDIEVIIKKTLVFTGLFAMVMAIVAAVTTLTQGIISRYWTVPPMVSTAASVMLAILFYGPTRKFLVDATDRFLFQKKQDVRVILAKLAEESVRIFDLKELAGKILTTLRETLRPETGAIFIKEANERQYGVLDAFGSDGQEMKFQKDDLFIHFLSASQRIFNLENPETRASLPVEIQEKIAAFKPVIIIPLFLQGDLTGFLFLGKKKSDEAYTPEELDSFRTIANQAAIGLNFARKLAEEKGFYAQMAQQAKMASLGTLSAGVAHEMGNTLNNIGGMVQTFRIWKKLGTWEKFSEPDKEKNYIEIVEGVNNNVTRAKGIMSRLNALAKNPEALAPEPIDLNTAVENGLWFTEKELEWAKINLKKNYASPLPDVMANEGVIAQTMMNLVMNSKDAIKMRGGPTATDEISVTTFFQDDKVGIKVSDTGNGIAEENLHKIFDAFFTTKDVSRNPDKNAIKGTGLGLFLVKRLVEHCGGEISVESEKGKGTIFYVKFPVAPASFVPVTPTDES